MMTQEAEKPQFAWWSHSKSRLMPFLNYYHIEGEDGTKYRVDYNFVRKLVRLSTQNIESGESYYAIIKDGNIIRERNANTELAMDLHSTFYPQRKIFSTLPNHYILQYIGGAYGIDKKRQKQSYRSSYHRVVEAKKKWTPKKIWSGSKDITKKYWNNFWTKNNETLPKRILKRIKGDLFDYTLAAAIVYALFLYSQDYCFTGKMLAFFGIFTGGVDWLYRKRNPLLLKIATISIPAAYLYLYGFMYQ